MRITGGQAGGICVVLSKGDVVRLEIDAMRQAVFSSLGAGVTGARFWDLFAGSGAYGLEAFSRGATGGVFVEKNAKAAEYIRQNIAAVCKSLQREAADLQVVNGDALKLSPGGVPDLVFIDPPYEIIPEVAPGLFARLAGLLDGNPDPLMVFAMPGELELSPTDCTCLKHLPNAAPQPTVGLFT